MAYTDRKGNRESNYELLRMLAGMAVIVLHFNYVPVGGGAMTNAAGTKYFVLLFLEVLCACAVNVFILLSGYFGCNSRKIKTGRLLELLMQTIVFSFVFCIASCLKNHNWEVSLLLRSLVPSNYFVILYITLMFLAPFINKLVDSLNDRDFSWLVLILFILFSVYTTMLDVVRDTTGNFWSGLSSIGRGGSMDGYSIINFIMVYIIGAWLRRNGFSKKISCWFLIFVLLGCIAVTMLWRKLLPGTAWTYCNPVIIVEACVVFILFGKLKVSREWINIAAPASFTCFLIQGRILEFMNDRITSSGSLLQTLPLLAGVVVGIYVVSVIAMFVWNYIANTVRRMIGKGIPDIRIE